MKRRSGATGAASKARGRKTQTPKRRVARKAMRPQRSSIASRETDIAQVIRERDEALEQQAATSEVLKVISGSPGDLQPVFDAMLENAVRICDATFGNIYRRNGDTFDLVASHKTPLEFAEFRKRSPIHTSPGSQDFAARLVETKAVIHVADVAAEQAYAERHDPGTVAAVELGGVRTFMAVPMLKEGELIGALLLSRQEVRPFTDKQNRAGAELRRSGGHRH